MNIRSYQLHAITWMLIGFASGAARADGPTTFHDDFANGLSPQWRTPEDASPLKCEKIEERGVLCFGKNAAGVLPRLYVLAAPGQWRDFTLDVEMLPVTGKFAGVCFRGGFDLFLDDKHRLFLRKDYQIVKMTEPLDLAADAFVKFQVVASGGDIRVSINGKPQIELHDQPQATGACGLIVHETEAKYAAFSITSEASVDKSVKIYTAPADGALIYPPGAAIEIPIVLENQSSTKFSSKLHASLALADASDDLGVRISGLNADNLLIAKSDEDGLELRIDGDDPFKRSRIGSRYITVDRVWPTLYARARIERTNGQGAGFVFARSQHGQSELYFDERGRLVLRRIAEGWKDVQVVAVSEASYPIDREHTVELTADADRVVATVDGAEALNAKNASESSGEAGLLFNRTAAVFRDLVLATSKNDPSAWRPKLVDTPRRVMEATQAVEIAPGKNEVKLKLPATNEGYHILTLALGDDAVKETYPLGVWKIDSSWSKTPENRIPLVVYGKYDWPSGGAVVSDTYLHAICWTLRKHGLNGVLHPFSDRRQLEIARRYGIDPVLRSPMAAWLSESDKTIVFVGDEPKTDNAAAYRQEYDQLHAKFPSAILLTCMVGETTGKNTVQDPLRIWEMLKPERRLTRHYPVRKAEYDVLKPNPDQTPFLDALDKTAAIETPWYFVAQTFGRDPTLIRPAPYWRNPNRNELSALSHAALAYGAKGLFFYTLQTEGSPALVYPRSLAACDEKLATLGELAKFVHAVEPVLLGAKPATFSLKSDAPQVIAKSITSGGASYAYLVNADSKETHKTSASVGKKLTRVTDQVSGKALPSTAEGDETKFVIEIPAGCGAMLKLD